MSGMTDKQFKAFIRSALNNLNEAIAEPDALKQQEKLTNIVHMFQQILED